MIFLLLRQTIIKTMLMVDRYLKNNNLQGKICLILIQLSENLSRNLRVLISRFLYSKILAISAKYKKKTPASVIPETGVFF